MIKTLRQCILLLGCFYTLQAFADGKPSFKTKLGHRFSDKPLVASPIRWVEDNKSIDCIRAVITPSVDSVKVGEELTLTIGIEYIAGLENMVGYMGDCQNFTLNVVLPEGFEQTGGNYQDFLRLSLDATHKSATVLLKGKFTTHNPNACFLVLRGSAKADASSLFIKKAQWCTKTYCSLTAEQIILMPSLIIGQDSIKKLLRIITPNALQNAFQYSLDGEHYQNSYEFDLPIKMPDFIYVKENNSVGELCLIKKSTLSSFLPSSARTASVNGGLRVDGVKTISRTENPNNNSGSTYEYTITDPTPPIGQNGNLYRFTQSKGIGNYVSDIPQSKFTITNQTVCSDYAFYIQRINGDGTVGAEKSNEVIVAGDPIPTITNKFSASYSILGSQNITLNSIGCPVGFSQRWFKNKAYVSSGQTLTNYIASGVNTNADYQFETGCYSNANNYAYDAVICMERVSITVMPCNSITLKASINKSVVCSGETLYFTGTSEEDNLPSIVTTYQWAGPNGFSSSLQNVSITSTPSMSGTYTLIHSVGKLSGLTTSCSVTATAHVLVFPTLQTPTITASKTSACYGETVSLTASGYTAGSKLLWSNGETTPIISTQLLTTGVFTVRAMDPVNGCNSPVSPTTFIPIPSSPAPLEMSENDIYYASGTISACYGATLRLRTSGCPVGSTYVWWDGQETATGLRTAPVAHTGNKVYTVSCKNSGSCISIPSKGTVIGLSYSTMTVTASATSIAQGTSATLTASGCAGQVKWRCCGAAFGEYAFTGSPLTVSPTVTTTYQAYCINGYCISAQSDPITITVTEPCNLTASINPSTAQASCQPVLLTANATGAATLSYQWYKDNTAITNATQATYTATTSGSYTVKAIASASCSLTSAATAVSIAPLTLTASSNSPQNAGSTLNLSATASGTATYSWAGPNNFASTSQNPSLTDTNISMSGTYTVSAQSASCTLTVTATLSVSIVPTCTLDFNNDPVLDCTEPEGSTPSLGKITVFTKGKTAGRTLEYLLERQVLDTNTGTASFVADSTYTTWRTDSVFVGLKKALYRVSIRETQSGSSILCKGISGTRLINVNCGGSRKQREHNPNCGVPPSVDLSNVKPLSRLMVGDTIWAGGDFEVVVTKITSSQSTNGTFSGFGFMKVPYMLDTQILVELKSAIINEDYEQVGGIIETTYDPNWSSLASIQNTVKDVAKLAKSLAEAISDLLTADLTKITKKQLEEMVKVIMEQAALELPPALQDQLKQATDALVAAKAAYDTTPNATTQASMDAAKTQVNQANQSRDTFLTQYANIVKLALQEIFTENPNFVAGQIDATEASTMSEAQVMEDEIEIPIADASWLQESEKTQIKTSLNTEFQKSKGNMANFFGRNFKDNAESIKQIATDLKKNGKSLSNYIYDSLQANVSQTQLVSEAKAVLYAKISEIVINRIYGSKNN